MKIQDLFERDIHRAINGVVKADQLDQSSVWQELDEFVVTRELESHFNDLIAVLLSALEAGADTTGKNGIWISGFFGSGKSHFIKVLSYLLENEEHELGGDHRRAVDFFEDKLGDALLFADLKQVAAAPADTILFNVDTKATHKEGRDALLQVFLKILNERQGFSGDHPHIAHMERHLRDEGKLHVFHEAYARAAGSAWLADRDAWEFHRDEVVTALAEALGQSQASVEKWVDTGHDNFSLSVENFARWVRHYLDRKGPNHQIMFLVDEVGQFIGSDTHLMLSLQTITEQLGTVCGGRAWVVVTSQEDLEAALGDLHGVKQHDFSKIQGRFKTRLSLSSSNVDEVIKARLLRKKPEVEKPLANAYRGKEDILKHQLSFVKAGRTFKTFVDVDDFRACYPFPAYQFHLVQKVFETIRKAGATGLHLSRGERSTLDAFQSAAKQIGSLAIGALVPFYRFFPAVEGFLDTAVKKSIDQAADNPDLRPFDATLLRVLFLIRYIDELPGNVHNLVTLCVDEIDADRLGLSRQIEESLARLEGQTLIARSGDLYFFLTNEERDIGREIKSMPIQSGSEARALGKLLFEDLLKDDRKHTYSLTKRDFTYSRLCDDHVVGQRLEGSLEVEIVTPLNDRFAEFSQDARCVLHTTLETQRILVRLPDDEILGRELRTYLQTDAYVKSKLTNTLPDTTKRILRDRNEDNRARSSRLVETLHGMLAKAKYFAHGQPLDIERAEPRKSLGDALDYLIRNAFSKMAYLRHLQTNPKQEIQSTLRANDVERVTLGLSGPDSNNQALEDLREYIRLCAQTNKDIVLSDLIEKRYARIPYGWPELEVVLLVATLAVLKEVELQVDRAALPLDQAYDHLTSSSKQRRVIIRQRESAGGELLAQAHKLGQELFTRAGPSDEQGLYDFLRSSLQDWGSSLASFEPLAKTGNYPGRDEIESGLALLQRYVDEEDSSRFLGRFVANESELRALAEKVLELEGFYTNQKHCWESLRASVDALAQNRLQLESNEEARVALARMEQILAMPQPYGVLHEVAAIQHVAEEVNARLVQDARASAVKRIESLLESLDAERNKVVVDDDATPAAAELDRLLASAKQSRSIAHIAQAAQAADAAFDRALAQLENSSALASASGPATSGDTSTQPAPPVRKRRVVEPSKLAPPGFLESTADVEDFLATLRAALESALAAGERIQIR